MFDLSFGEILLVVVVTVVFIGPKELPTVIKAITKAVRYMRSVAQDFRRMFDEIAEESGVKDIEKEIKLIEGDDGKMYESYDISFISSPSKGEDKGGG